jgi:hypothetical protein
MEGDLSSLSLNGLTSLYLCSCFLFHGLAIDEHEMNKIGMTGIHLRHDRGAKIPNRAVSSIIHQGDSQENNYNYFNRFNPQIQYRLKNLSGFVEKSPEGSR